MLTNSQLNALKVIKNFIDDPIRNVMCLSGSPGTGKSYLIQTEVPKLLSKWQDYVITATTNKAASILRGKTIYSFFGIKVKKSESKRQELNFDHMKDIRNTFIVIDEASMISKELWQKISPAKNCKFLLVGDKYQLPPVGSSYNVFETYPTVELTDVVRQKDPDFLEEINKCKQGVIDKCMYIPEENSCIEYLFENDKDKVLDILKSFDENDKILTFTNDAAIEYATNVRTIQGKSNELRDGDPIMNRYYCETPYGSRSALYAEQELVIEHITAPFMYTIPKTQDSLEVRQVTFKYTPGNYLMVVNPDFRSVLLKKYVKDKNWIAYYFLKDHMCDLRYNESCTIHCAQGSTYNRCFIDLNDLNLCTAHSVKARLMYVALSRAKDKVYIYEQS